MVAILIILSIAMIALLLLIMAAFGVRGLTYRRSTPLAIASVIGPIALLVVLGLVVGDWARGGIYAILITFAITVVTMTLSGLRGFFS